MHDVSAPWLASHSETNATTVSISSQSLLILQVFDDNGESTTEDQPMLDQDTSNVPMTEDAQKRGPVGDGLDESEEIVQDLESIFF